MRISESARNAFASLSWLALLCFCALFLTGCQLPAWLSGAKLFEPEPAPVKLCFEAWIVENPEGAEVFFCRPLFETGTGEGLEVTGYSDKAVQGKPIAMRGKLKDARKMQEQLIVCGLMESITAGSGEISALKDMRLRLPLLDTRKEITVRRTMDGIELSGMPAGMPDTIRIALNPGESVVLAWFDKNRQLTLIQWRIENVEGR